MISKTTVLSVVAGVLAAIALPAVASANWKHHNTAIQQSATINLTGNIRFQGGLGGIECQIKSRVKLNPGTTGVLETFVPHRSGETVGTETENCKGLGGLAFCQFHNLTPQAPNWTIHTGLSAIEITTGAIKTQATGGFCPIKQFELGASGVFPGITLTPNFSETTSSMWVGGQLTAWLLTNGGFTDVESVTASGSLSLGFDGFTYSI